MSKGVERKLTLSIHWKIQALNLAVGTKYLLQMCVGNILRELLNHDF